MKMYDEKKTKDEETNKPNQIKSKDRMSLMKWNTRETHLTPCACPPAVPCTNPVVIIVM